MDEKREQKRAQQREYFRRKRAERAAKGLCRDCGKPANHRELKGVCFSCGEKQRARNRAKQKPKPPPLDVTCPDCQGPCKRGGFAPNGKQRYICKKCGHANLGTGERRRYFLKGQTYEITLELSQRAVWGLEIYQEQHGVSANQAIREIFRQAAEEPAHPMAVGQHTTLPNGKRITRLILPPKERVEPVTGPVYLRDLRSESLRERMKRVGYAKYRPNILVIRQIRVTLDGLAMAGLLKKMRAWNRNHQDTARMLLERLCPIR